MKLTSILNPDCILYDLEGNDRRSIYQAMISRIIEETDLDLEPNALTEGMIEREDSMRIPYEGLALPHLRDERLHDLYVGIGILKEPVRLKEYDARPTGIIVMSLVSENTSDIYLRMLTTLVNYLSIPGNIGKLLECRTPQELMDCLDQDNVRLKKDITAEDIMSCQEIVRPGLPLRDALDSFVRTRTSCLPVADEHGILLGVIDAAEVIHRAIPEYLFMMDNVKFLNTFEPFERIFRDEYSQRIEEYITQPKLTVSPDTPLIQVTMALISGKAHAIVVVGPRNEYMGMISIEDVVHKILRG